MKLFFFRLKIVCIRLRLRFKCYRELWPLRMPDWPCWLWVGRVFVWIFRRCCFCFGFINKRQQFHRTAAAKAFFDRCAGSSDKTSSRTPQTFAQTTWNINDIEMAKHVNRRFFSRFFPSLALFSFPKCLIFLCVFFCIRRSVLKLTCLLIKSTDC